MFLQSTPEKKKCDNNTMASSSSSSSALKSQPLHNFQLHDLKWAMNHTNTQRLRKLSDTPSHHQQQRPETDSESEEARKRNKPPPSSGGSSLDHLAKSDNTTNNKKIIIKGSGSNVEKTTPSDGSRSKLLIRLRTKSIPKPVDEVPQNGDQNSNADDAEDFVPKTWNLRPRKPIPKPNSGTKIQSSPAHENKAVQRPESSRSRNVTEPKPADKKPKKLKFSVSLTREEIDDDIFAMTGSKASRRPKRRPKHVQKQLDLLCPGFFLSSVTTDCYKVPDPPLKN